MFVREIGILFGVEFKINLFFLFVYSSGSYFRVG